MDFLSDFRACTLRLMLAVDFYQKPASDYFSTLRLEFVKVLGRHFIKPTRFYQMMFTLMRNILIQKFVVGPKT